MRHGDNQWGIAAGDGEPGQSGFSDHRDRIAKAQPGVTSDMTSLWFESALLQTGWASHVRVTAANGRIERVATDVEPNDTDERLDVGIPGVPNLHSHSLQRGIAGLTERRGTEGDSFWTWRELMYQFVDSITPDEMEAIASLAYAEMLECGFTRVGGGRGRRRGRGGGPGAGPAGRAGRSAAASVV